MNDVMIAAVYHGVGDIRFDSVPVPRAAPGELLLEVGTVGVCGSDVGEWVHGPHQHPVDNAHPVTKHHGPIVMGHEYSGTVRAVGDGVDQSWIGKRVASCGSGACGQCGACLRGESNQCRQYFGVGLHRDGALAEFVTTPLENCLSIEGLGISLDEAALCQPMSIAVHNVARAGNVSNQTVLVQGAGGIGAFLVYALVEAGADVIAADIDPDRLLVAASLGARATILATASPDDAVAIADKLGEQELRVIFEVSGTKHGLLAALEIAPKGCRIVLVGIQKEPVEIDLARITVQEMSLIGTNALVRETDFHTAVELISRRRSKWSDIAPSVVPMVPGLVDDALIPISEGRSRAIKTLIDPRGKSTRPIQSEPESVR